MRVLGPAHVDRKVKDGIMIRKYEGGQVEELTAVAAGVSWLEQFAGLTAPRVERTKRHPLSRCTGHGLQPRGELHRHVLAQADPASRPASGRMGEEWRRGDGIGNLRQTGVAHTGGNSSGIRPADGENQASVRYG